MKFVEKIKTVLFDAHRFFNTVKSEKGIGNAFLYYIILLVISSILSTVVNLFIFKSYLTWIYGLMGMPSSVYGNIFSAASQSTMLVSMLPIGIILNIIGLFIITGILHLWILIFGGKGKYGDTFKIFTYGHTPSLVFGWIPFIGFFVWIYTMILEIIGTEKLHNVTRTRAILIYVIPLIVGLALLFVGLFYMWQVFANMPMLVD